MTTVFQKANADAALAALKAAKPDAEADLETAIENLIIDLGHLAEARELDFLTLAARGIRGWAIERINPNYVGEGPLVEIQIDGQGLSRKPAPDQTS
ncbi:MAG: hypothetical protein NW215_00530 [Hyphomicrobiales bacterium]|nr:hypothetical protein [Hyphomicrobiales bacterium]